MNNFPSVTVVFWDTRSWRHADRAAIWCRDYGLRQVSRSVFAGELYQKEKAQLKAKFESLFTLKTEKFFFMGLCKSCFDEGGFNPALRQKIKDMATFELIQAS